MTKRIKNIPFKWIRRCLLLILLVTIWIVMRHPNLGEAYALNIYPYISMGLSFFSSLFSISIGDCFIYGSILILIIYIIVGCFHYKEVKQTILGTLEFLAWAYVWFYLAWGINYFRNDFYTRTKIQPIEYSAEGFQYFLSNYTDSLNATYCCVDSIDKALVAEEVNSCYLGIADQFGINKPSAKRIPKTMLISSLMSSVGVLGYMGPFFNEFNLNRDLLPIQYPATYAHEMAHVLGISSEAEANLYSFLVCSRSNIPEIRFSGYFALLPYVLGNAYRLLDEEEFNIWKDSLKPEVRDLYNMKQQYWHAKYSPFIGKIQNAMYNVFLKGNNIPSGRQNYSEVIGLLIALNTI